MDEVSSDGRSLIDSAWKAFREHAGECVACGTVDDAIIQVLNHSFSVQAIRETFAGACEHGNELLWAWDMACQNAQEAGGTVSKRLGVWHDGPMLQPRQEALMALPDREFRRLLALEPDEARMAEVDAITRAHMRTRMVVLPTSPDGAKLCAHCGGRLRNPDHEVCTSCYRKGKR